MPVVMSCDCGKQLRVADEHVGKKIRCPGCGEPVVVKAPAASKTPATPAKKPMANPPPTPTAGMVTFGCECGKKMQAKAEFAGRTVKCPECGEAVKVPKAGAAPAKKTQPDEDDAPVSRRIDGLLAGKGRQKAAPKDEDEDEDDAPRGRGRRDAEEDEDEDAPRGRRDPDDSDAEDDRPRKGAKKGKKAKKGGGSMMPVLLIGGGVLLLLLIGGLVAWMFLGGSSAAGDMALVPGNAGGFATVRVADLLNTDLGKEAMKEAPAQGLAEMETKLGLKPTDIERVTTVFLSLSQLANDIPGIGGGGRPGAGGAPEMYVIMTASKTLDQPKVLESMNLKGVNPTDYNGKKYYSSTGGAVYFHTDRTMVMGPTAEVIKKAIDQAVKPNTSGQLSKLTSRVGSQHLVVGGTIPAEMAAAKAQIPPDFAALGDIQQVMLAGNVKGTTVELDFTGLFPDSGKAGSAKTIIDNAKGALALFMGNPQIPKEARDAMNSLTVTQSGSDVTIGVKAPIDLSQLKQNLPGIGGGLFPGGGGVGVVGAADRARDQNNLKQMALAFHNWHDGAGKMNYAIFNPQPPGRTPLHSWRVAILPYIEQDTLYKQIKLNELWNSPANQQFHNRMPDLFKVPGRDAGPNKTFYQVFVGTGAMFERNSAQGRTLAGIADGTSNTILIVEGATAVNWMEPADINYSAGPNGFTAAGRLGGRFPEGFNAAFADGSVKFIPRSFSPRDLQAIITPNGAEIVNLP